MMFRSMQLIAQCAAFVLGTSALAGEPSTWISMNDAIQIAQQATPNTSPIKAELYVVNTMAFFEVKAFAGNTLYEFKVNAANGHVFDVDDSDGGGAQDKIAEAQFVMGQSIFTFTQAMAHVQSLYPDYYLTMIEMEEKDGVAIFDVRMIRGPYKLEVRIAANSGAILRQKLNLLPGSSLFVDLYFPNEVEIVNIDNVVPTDQVLAMAQQQFAATPFDIQLKTPTPSTSRYQLRLYKNNTVIKAVYDGATGTYLWSQVVNDPQYIAKVQTSLGNASLSLQQAIAQAKTVVPGGFAVEAKLRLQNDGNLYGVEFVTTAGILEVKLNSTTGAIKSISFDD